MRAAAIALVAWLLQDAPSQEVLVGTLARDEKTGIYSIGETVVTIAPTVHAGHTLVGKRVQILGTRASADAALEATLVNEMQPEDKDLLLRIEASAAWGDAAEDDKIVVEVREYAINKRHKHPGSCKMHAWTRVRVEGKARESTVAAELGVPAYRDVSGTRIYVRVTAPRCAASESGEFQWTGKQWTDANLKDIEGRHRIELTAKEP
jgi:hypothetical protein